MTGLGWKIPAKLRPAQAAMGQPGTKIGELCAELGVSRQTFHLHMDPKGTLRPGGEKQFGQRRTRMERPAVRA